MGNDVVIWFQCRICIILNSRVKVDGLENIYSIMYLFSSPFLSNERSKSFRATRKGKREMVGDNYKKYFFELFLGKSWKNL